MERDDMDELQLFESIIRGQEFRDEGIVSYDAELREFEALLRERYLAKGFVAIPKQELDKLQAEINERWHFEDEIATVSGKLKVVLEDPKEMVEGLVQDIAVADEDGETLHDTGEDPDGDICFMNVEAAKLVAGEIIVNVIEDAQKNLTDIEVGYIFYHLNDEEGDTPFFAQHSSLYRHDYETPSPEEARARLEKNWPEQLEMIDQVLLSGGPLAQRLAVIAHMVNAELKDETFRQLTELYINEELELRNDTAYMTMVRSRIDVLEDVDDDSSEWVRLDIQGGIIVYIQNPEVRFSAATDELGKSPEAYLFGITFNDEDGKKPEVVCIPVVNIERFVSTSAATSLARRAIDAMDRKIEEDMATMLELGNRGEVVYSDVATEIDATPEYVNQLELIEEALARARMICDEYLLHTFTTHEAALADAQILLKNVNGLLNGTRFSEGVHIVEVMGQDIKLPNLKHNLFWNEEQHTVFHGVDKDVPVLTLPLGDKVIGKTAQLYADVESTLVSEEGDSAVTYTPRVVMAVIIADGFATVVGNAPPLSQLHARNQASVPLDSSSDISFFVLDQYRASRDALTSAQKMYGHESPLMKRIRLLDEAVNNENPDDFTAIDHTIISRFPVDLGRVARRHKQPPEPAVTVLEVLLSDRTIISASDVLKPGEDGQLELDLDSSGSLRTWRVIDIKPKEGSNEVMMFVESPKDEQYRHIPLSTITDFRF